MHTHPADQSTEIPAHEKEQDDTLDSKAADPIDDLEEDWELVQPPKKKVMTPQDYEKKMKENFLKKWMNVIEQDLPEKSRSNRAMDERSAYIGENFYFTTSTTTKWLDGILKNDMMQTDRHVQPLALVTVGRYGEINRYHNKKIFHFNELSQRHWEHLHLPCSLTDAEDPLAPFYIAWCIDQIRKKIQSGSIVVFCIDATEQNVLAGMVMAAYFAIYLPNKMGLGNQTASFSNTFSSKSSSSSISSSSSSSSLTTNSRTDSFLHSSSSGLSNSRFTTAVQLIDLKLQSSQFPLRIQIEDTDSSSSKKGNAFSSKSKKKSNPSKWVSVFIKVIDLYQQHHHKMEDVYQAHLIHDVFAWSRTNSFKELMIFLISKISQKKTSIAVVNGFLNAFIEDFDLARHQLRYVCIKDIDSYCKNPLVNQQKFIGKHADDPIGKLFCDLYLNQQFREVLLELLNDLVLFDKTHAFHTEPVLTKLDEEDCEELIDIWKKMEEEVKECICKSSVQLELPDKKNMELYFCQDKIVLINQLIESVMHYCNTVYFDYLLNELHGDNLFNKSQKIKFQFEHQGYPFGMALSMLDRDRWMKCLNLYCALFLFNEKSELDVVKHQKQMFVRLMYTKMLNKRSEGVDQREFRIFMFQFTDDLLENYREYNSLVKQIKTKDSDEVEMFVYFFKLICEEKKSRKKQSQDSSQHTVASEAKCFDPVTQYIYVNVLNTLAQLTKSSSSDFDGFRYVTLTWDEDIKKNDQILGFYLIREMNQAILSVYSESSAEQIKCLQEIVVLLSTDNRSAGVYSSELQLNSMFKKVESSMNKFLLESTYLDHVLLCSQVAKVMDVKHVSPSPVKQDIDS